MKQRWEMLKIKVDGMSLRERALIFAAAAFTLTMLTKTQFLDPLLANQKNLAANVEQQQEKTSTIRTQIDASSQARKSIESSPLHQRLDMVKQKLADGDAYLKDLDNGNGLVKPEKMAALLEQVLAKNNQLQLVHLQTLPVTPLVKKAANKPEAPAGASSALDKQIFKHGVELTVRGSYLDLLQYLTELEQLQVHILWGNAEMKVEHYPDVVLTVTVYTLSLDKTWLTV